MNYKRIFVIVIDSLGIGAMADAPDYDDYGVNTLGHILEQNQDLTLPNMEKLGILDLVDYDHTKNTAIHQPHTMGICRKLQELSRGKDTMTGHWEMMGVHTTTPFVTFTETGFPKELIEALEERCGRTVIGNKASSGTVILDELAKEEGDDKLIVYTSSDSVLQICGNEETMGLDNLYRYCEIARELTMKEEWKVGRVIARPYICTENGYKRTANRHDYALKPPHPTVLNALCEAGLDVISVGKIRDIFDGEGITRALHSESSVHGMEQTIALAGEEFYGLCFVNLVDFDALYGHRRDPIGYGAELKRFDEKLGRLLEELKSDDLVMITADHGNDPTYKGSDHTREQVPLLMYSEALKEPSVLEEANTFAIIGKMVADNFGVSMPENCIAFLTGFV